MIDAIGSSGSGSGQLRELLDAGVAALSQATAAWRDEARAAARGVRALSSFARHRPQVLFDRQPGERGAMSAASRAARPEVLTEVSEWAVDEVALALRMSGPAASGRLCDALTLVERLPGTLALLDEGRISWAHAQQMITQVGPVVDDALRARIEARVLGLLKRKTPPQLGDCARRIVLREDADAAARRLLAAVRGRGVRLVDRRDGSATVVLDLPLPVAAAIHRALEAYAEQARTEGDERTKQQRMADVVADLVLRPGDHGMPPVTVALTLVATLETMLGGNEPGQVEGHLVPAEAVRELARTFGLLPRPEPELSDLPAADESVEPEPGPEPGPRPQPAARPDPEVHLTEEGGDRPPLTSVRDRPLAEWMALAAARHRAAVDEALAGARQAVLDGTWTDGDARGVLDADEEQSLRALGALIGVHDIAGTGLAHRPHIAVVDRLRGSLVALTDAAGLRRGQPLGPPAGTDEHDVPAGLARFVRLRTAAAASPAAGPGPVSATWTTRTRGRAGRPSTPTCAASACTTTASSTRHPAGASRRATTVGWSSPRRVARHASATRRGSAPTSTSRPTSGCRLVRAGVVAQQDGDMADGDATVELNRSELREVAAHAVACATPALALYERECPGDPRPRTAVEAARVFAEGGERTKSIRDGAWAALRAAGECRTAGRAAATEAARAAVAVAGAPYLHPLARATQVGHVLGAAAHTARALELAAGDGPGAPDAGADHLARCRDLARPAVVDVLRRYPSAPGGGGRVGELIRRLDASLR